MRLPVAARPYAMILFLSVSLGAAIEIMRHWPPNFLSVVGVFFILGCMVWVAIDRITRWID